MKKAIGIVGGVGPYAGLEFNKKIFDSTPAHSDQEHLNVILITFPSQIQDRTEYLLNRDRIPNPAEGIFQVILQLEKLGADFVAIPCNTAHSPEIMDRIQERVAQAELKVKLINMLHETFDFLKQEHKDIRRVGLLATKGTHQSKVYESFSNQYGIELMTLDSEGIDRVHSSIYDPKFGIKAKSNPIDPEARFIIESSANHLISQGAQMVIMGCTEIPLALNGVELAVPLLDPMDVTARTLVRLAMSH